VKARVWKNRTSGVWLFYVCGQAGDSSGFRLTWAEALTAALAEMGMQRAAGA
jgi:hypothetical protein